MVHCKYPLGYNYSIPDGGCSSEVKLMFKLMMFLNLLKTFQGYTDSNSGYSHIRYMQYSIHCIIVLIKNYIG